MSNPTVGQQEVADLVKKNAPSEWTLHWTRYLPQACTLQMTWDQGTDRGGFLNAFDIFIGKRTTYKSVQLAYPELLEM